MKIKILPLAIAVALAITLTPGEAGARSGSGSRSSFSRPSSPSRSSTSTTSRPSSAPAPAPAPAPRTSTTSRPSTPSYSAPIIRSSPAPAPSSTPAPVRSATPTPKPASVPTLTPAPARPVTPIIIAPEIEFESAPPITTPIQAAPATTPVQTPNSVPVAPAPVQTETEPVDMSWLGSLVASLAVAIGGLLGLILLLWLIRQIIDAIQQYQESRPTETTDDRLTVFRVQVAFSAEGNEPVRNYINEAVKSAGDDVESNLEMGGLAALKVARTSHSLTHANVVSLNTSAETAEQEYDRLITEERTKFTSDSYFNQAGTIFRDGLDQTDINAEAPGRCFVVTWVLCVEQNSVPFNNVRSVEQVVDVLTYIRSQQASQVCAAALFVHPAEGPGLSEDEFNEKYPYMLSI